jgi:hypothetical protein
VARQTPASSWDQVFERVDWASVARGASTGFGGLVVSGLVQVAASRVLPWLGPAPLLLGSLIAFILAGYRAGDADAPAATGAVAALFAYTLTLPLCYLVHQPLTLAGVAGFIGGALLVGSATGAYMARRHARHSRAESLGKYARRPTPRRSRDRHAR